MSLAVTADTHLSPAQAATLLHVTPARVRQLIDAGHLPAVRTALGRLVERSAVERLAAARAERTPAC